MKEALNQLFEKGFIEVTSNANESSFLLDATSNAVTEILKNIPKDFVLLFEHEGVLERFFPEIPETYFQLLEVNQKPLDVILENPKGFNPALDHFTEFYCMLSLGQQLTQLLQRFRKPLLWTHIPASTLNSAEFKLLLQPENQKIQLNLSKNKDATIIHFKADGTFKMLKK